MYTKLTATMIAAADRKAKAIVDLPNTLKRAGIHRMFEFRDEPAIVAAGDGDYRLMISRGREVEHIDCTGRADAQAKLEAALEAMTPRAGTTVEQFIAAIEVL